MNKKAVIGLIILLILVIAGILYVGSVYKIDSEIPQINSNLNNGNTEYNNGVLLLNNRKYDEAQKKFNTTLSYYHNARQKTETAMTIAQTKEDKILEEYFTVTLAEIDSKINAINEIMEGITVRNNSSSEALSHYANSNSLMNNSTQYSDRRNQIEQQHPEKFITG
jgi:Tfp pilus assembly protein PilF